MSAADDPVVELPTYTVSETMVLPPPESWRYAEVPGYEILSSLSERETRRFVRDFQLLQQAIAVVWPALFSGREAPPSMIILSRREAEFHSFVPTALRGDAGFSTSVFVQDEERSGIVVDFVRTRPGDGTVAAGGSDDEFVPGGELVEVTDPYREFYFQYFRTMIRRSAPNAPRWLEEGLVRVLGSVDFSKRMVEIGRIDPTDEYDFTAVLKSNAVPPFASLFTVDRDTRALPRNYQTLCHAFVHLCLYGEGRKFQEPFRRLVDAALRGPIDEATFRKIFGMDYRRMEYVIRSYSQFTYYQHPQFRAKRGTAGFAEPPPFELRDATQAEVGRIKGEIYRLAGHADRAYLALIAPYVRGERDARLLASLGLNERSRGEHARARKFLEAAALAGVERPRAWLELARLRLEEARAQPASGDGRLGIDQVDAIVAALMRARAQRPPLPDVYEELAGVWARSARPPDAEALAVIYEGAITFPGRQRLLYLAASLATEYGRLQDARPLVDHGLNHARPDVRPHFVALDERLRARSLRTP